MVKAAIERLKDEDQIREIQGRIYSRGAVRVNEYGPSDGELHGFRVEKVHSGKAVVEVDGKWRAVLSPEDYNGPRHLIKKGKSFRGIADLYHEEGKLHVWIKDVTGR